MSHGYAQVMRHAPLENRNLAYCRKSAHVETLAPEIRVKNLATTTPRYSSRLYQPGVS